MVDELELGWHLVPAPTVAVTGSNGKSTVSDLCLRLLAARGLDPALAGNTEFGPPLSEIARGEIPRSVVAEVSSFQAGVARDLAPDAAIAECSFGLRGAELAVQAPDGRLELGTRLPGRDNAANVTAALVFADWAGVPRETTLATLAAAEPVPGRFELVEVDRPSTWSSTSGFSRPRRSPDRAGNLRPVTVL